MELQCWHVMRCAPELELHDSIFPHCNIQCKLHCCKRKKRHLTSRQSLASRSHFNLELIVVSQVLFYVHFVGTNGNTHTPARVKVWLPWSHSATFAFSLFDVSDTRLQVTWVKSTNHKQIQAP